MVRAGVVNHPENWQESGFSEIQKPPNRYAIIDLRSLVSLSGFAEVRDFQRAHREWVEQAPENGVVMRDDRWSESIAVGSLAFVESLKNQLGVKGSHRHEIEADGTYALREPAEAYGLSFAAENDALSSQNTFFWNEIVDEATT